MGQGDATLADSVHKPAGAGQDKERLLRVGALLGLLAKVTHFPWVNTLGKRKKPYCGSELKFRDKKDTRGIS